MGLETALIAGGLAAAGGTVYAANKSAKAASSAQQAQQQLLANLKYEPIDIEKLKTDATAQSIANAKASIALEKELSPDIASMRTELPKQISSELATGGRLSPDVANQIASQARTIGGGSGSFFGVGPITAALTGTTAQNLIDQRQQKAASMLAQNQLPTVGLDAGSLASLEAQNNAALNQFNLAKAGVGQNAINSNYQAQMANIGTVAGGINSLGSLASQIGLLGLARGSSTPATTTAGTGAFTAGTTPFTSTVNPAAWTVNLNSGLLR